MTLDKFRLAGRPTSSRFVLILLARLAAALRKGAFFALDVGVFSTDDVSSAIVNNGAMAPKAGTQQSNKGKDCANSADDHQDHSDGMKIESVLIRICSERKIENCPHRECDNACY